MGRAVGVDLGTAVRPQQSADADSAPAGTPDDRNSEAVRVLKDRWRRAMAELDNLRKRFERQLAGHEHEPRPPAEQATTKEQDSPEG
jgi:hypothetical protein